MAVDSIHWRIMTHTIMSSMEHMGFHSMYQWYFQQWVKKMGDPKLDKIVSDYTTKPHPSCPCDKCICNAICRNKKWDKISNDCDLVNGYLRNVFKYGGYLQLNLEEVNKALGRSFYIQVGSYGAEFIKDRDEPSFKLKKEINPYYGRGKSGK